MTLVLHASCASGPMTNCLCGAAGALSLCGLLDRSLLLASESWVCGGMLDQRAWQRQALSSGGGGGRGYRSDSVAKRGSVPTAGHSDS